MPEADHETPPTGLPLVECLAPEDWDTPVANHHYSLGQIAGALSLMLDCRGSLRGAALATGLINRLLGGEQEVPSPTSVRSWLLRIGLHQLQRPLEKAGDWVWIVDHTVQIGELKCMIIVGFRLGVWQQQEDRTLAYEDVELIGLWPVRTSTGELVDEQLESAIARTGFATRANQMKRQVHQTELAFCNSPQQRGKARYMSVDTLVAWGVKVLKWLDEPQPTGRELDAERIAENLGWLRDYRAPLRQWEQAMQVIETAETLVRREGHHAEKYKTLQGEKGQFGATSMLLAIGAFVGRLTVSGIGTALQTIKGAALDKWEQINLGSTIQSQRKQAFPSPNRGIETGSNQLGLTGEY